MNILYVGPISRESTCLQRYRALQSLGHNLVGISTMLPFGRSRNRLLRLISRILCKFLITSLCNWRIRRLTRKQSFDIVWIDKGLLIAPATLAFVHEHQSEAKLMSYSPDDMMNPANQNLNYLRCISMFDFHVTTKSYNVSELQALGAKKVIFVGNAYDPEVHRPVVVDASDGNLTVADVGFIGAYEKERTLLMDRLAKDGVDVVFHCPSWPIKVGRPKYLRITEGFLERDDYAKQICTFKINLAFLRKVNRDLQTTRSIEIPACGAFMLAERTSEHLDLFEEGEEAEFFSDYDELFAKVKFYLGNESKRIKIAESGLCRVRSSGYSNQERLRRVVEAVSRSRRI